MNFQFEIGLPECKTNGPFAAAIFFMSADARIRELKLELPPAPKPVAVYKPVVVVGNLAYVSGHGPVKPDKTLITGRVGADLDLEGGKRAARQVGLAILATLRAHLGSLDKVARVIKTLGMVNCTPEFRDHPAVINGWGEERGRDGIVAGEYCGGD